MANNIAARRGRKAARRKQVLAERRDDDHAQSTPAGRMVAQIKRGTDSPFYACMMPQGFENGMGTIVVARGHGVLLTVAFFLADTFALGVKDAFVRSMDSQQFDEVIERMSEATPLEKADPAYVRKFLRDLVAWSRDIGFEPGTAYAVIEGIFGDVDAAGSDATFTFGLNGAPMYMSGPNDTPAMVMRNMAVINRYNDRKELPPPTSREA